MRRTEQVMLCALLALALLAFFVPSASPADADSSTEITINERPYVPAGTEMRFAFTATSNNVFRFQSFGGKAFAQLYTKDTLIQDGYGFSFDTRLTQGEKYVLVVTTEEAGASVEIMRAAFGRYFERPTQLMADSEVYKKRIARAYDTHWYQFTAEASGLHSIYAASELPLTGVLLGESGAEIDTSLGANPPSMRGFYIQAELVKGHTYYLRISAQGDAAGDYALSIAPPQQNAATGVQPAKETYVLSDGERAQLEYTLTPAGAEAAVLFSSSDTLTLTIDGAGMMTAVGCGEAFVTVVAGQSIYAVIKVVIEAVPAKGLSFSESDIFLNAGQSQVLAYEVAPGNASDKRVAFTSSDERVATVSVRGEITAAARGEAIIKGQTEDGAFSDEVRVSVGEALPKYRALLIGELKYSDGRTRLGSANTTQGMFDLLSNVSYDGEKYQINMRMDATRAQVIAQIRRTFRDAAETDVSLFYINCHAAVRDGVAYLEFSDQTSMTPAQLERELRRVPGKVIVLIDCCESGAFISSGVKAFNESVIQAFSEGGASPFSFSKYLVMTSAASTQKSYRVNYNKSENEDMNATAFSLSLSEAGGWDLIKDKRISPKADLDKDKVVSFHDAYLYARRRVHQLLSKSHSVQDVQVYPHGSNFSLFERS